MKIVGMILALLGLACGGFGVYFLLTAARLSGWTRVEGTVLRTAIRAERMAGAGRAAPFEDRTRYLEYVPVITYGWTVGGTSYEGSRFRLGDTHDKFESRAEARAALQAYPSGGAVTVFYDPSDPASAVLDTRTSWAVWAPLGLGVVLFGLGLVLIRRLG